MTFDELPPKTMVYFLDKISWNNDAIIYFNKCNKYGRNAIQAIKMTIKLYGNWQEKYDIIFPEEIEQELFSYILCDE